MWLLWRHTRFAEKTKQIIILIIFYFFFLIPCTKKKKNTGKISPWTPKRWKRWIKNCRKWHCSCVYSVWFLFYIYFFSFIYLFIFLIYLILLLFFAEIRKKSELLVNVMENLGGFLMLLWKNNELGWEKRKKDLILKLFLRFYYYYILLFFIFIIIIMLSLWHFLRHECFNLLPNK